MKQVQEMEDGLFATRVEEMLTNNALDNTSLETSDSAESTSLDIPTSLPRTTLQNAPSPLPASGFLPDISRYIPAGYLPVERHKSGITLEVWRTLNEWHGFVPPAEFVTSANGLFLQKTLQELLFSTPVLQHYSNLHQAGWIRLEFKMRDAEWGQARVYILPDDIGNQQVDRGDNFLRKSLRRLVAELDTAKDTRDGHWSPSTPTCYTELSSEGEKEYGGSLSHLFNNLPSPKPSPSIVQDTYAKSAMEKILEGDVEGLTAKMFAFQRRSAAMMLQKEAKPALTIDPRLREKTDQNSNAWYYDVSDGTVLRVPRMYEAARGGIMAETMGVGKTLICLALILATRDIPPGIPDKYSIDTFPVRPRVGSLLDMSAATIGRTGTPWKSYFNELRKKGLEFERCNDAIRRGTGFYYIPKPAARRLYRRRIDLSPKKVYLTTATLIVVPANLVRQWESEIKIHTSGILKVLVLCKNADKLPQATELAEYDIILFSRQRFEKESRDGTDAFGRRIAITPHKRSCLVGMNELCDCFDDGAYRSPLRDLHFKRLITDEGHTMGNSNSTVASNAVIVVDFLNVSSRWIVSGTPTQGLYDESILTMDEMSDISNSDTGLGQGSVLSASNVTIDHEQERKDLEKLGNIVTHYLKARPWSNTREDGDIASWSQYVMQPRHGSWDRGNTECLRKTLEDMIIRHRVRDIEKEVKLPPLKQKFVYLDGSLQDKLSLNLFSLVITSNAITSERKDADYLFHPKQRRALDTLVANLRQASFFWSSIQKDDVEFTIKVAKAFLKSEVYITHDDRHLLQKVVDIGSAALSNPIWLVASKYHEIPFYVENEFGAGERASWALDSEDQNPTLLGGSQLLLLHKFVNTPLVKRPGSEGLKIDGEKAMEIALLSIPPAPTYKSKVTKIQRKLDKDLRALAGVPVDRYSSLKKLEETFEANDSVLNTPPIYQDLFNGSASTNTNKPGSPTRTPDAIKALQMQVQQGVANLPSPSVTENPSNDGPVTLNMDQSESTNVTQSEVPFASTNILSTASSKLSYLVSQVAKYQKDEKIIIFYDSENIAYYISQALEAINIESLIYHKSLSSDIRSRHIVKFNTSPRFRCLLMDLSQAAFGVNVPSASRVFFVNPVLNKQIEAQAVKRAHRIGQSRPVYVETLVLKGSVEEVILERRNVMSNDEQRKCKTILDDKPMYDWIKNLRFVAMPEGDIPSTEQMAKLDTPQPIFNFTKDIDSDEDPTLNDLDRELIYRFNAELTAKRNRKRKSPGSTTETADDGNGGMEAMVKKTKILTTS